ncbi:hypothetical protein DV738_g3097, partial [Chaetothyriales sp. CBS 135597]
MAMTKIAVAGTNGLAQLIAHFISTITSHPFVILSRGQVPGLSSKGWQVLVVDYNNTADLKFKLAGVDTVISTVSGTAQLNLIDAAASAHVRRFVPSEFGGPPSLRPEGDRLDNHHREAILKLLQLEPHGMSFTVFTCGVLYERFAPGGLSSSQIGVNKAIGREDCTFQVSQYTRTSLADAITFARAVRDEGKEMQLCQIVATAEGQYDFTDANLCQLLNYRPEKFRDYLARVWAPA